MMRNIKERFGRLSFDVLMVGFMNKYTPQVQAQATSEIK